MTRTFFLLMLAVGLLVSPVAAGPAGGEAIPAITRGPYIVPAGPGTLAVHIWTDQPVGALVEFGPVPETGGGGNFSRVRASAEPSTHHRILLTGLAPGTSYRYRVLYGGASTGDLHFLTCPETGPVTFLVMGDSRDEPPAIRQEERFGVVAARAAAEPMVHFLVHTGDLVLDGNREEDWDRFFRAGGALLANTTLLPARGNHDGSPERFTDLFGTPPNFTFPCGDVQVAVIDSRDDAWKDLPAQAAWLEAAVAKGPPVRFAALHYPLLSSDERHFGGWENLRETFAPVLARTGVLAVFQGHVHLYERDQEGGIEFITDARAGAPPYHFGAAQIPQFRRGLEDSLGYSRVTVRSRDLPPVIEVIRVADLRDRKVSPVPHGEEVVESISLPAPGTVPQATGDHGITGSSPTRGSSHLAEYAFLGEVLDIFVGDAPSQGA